MRGFTLQETLLVLLLGVIATAAAMPVVRHSIESVEDAQLAEMLGTIVRVVRDQHAQATTYSGLTTAQVLPRVPASWAFGADAVRHPLSGTIVVAASSADPAQFELTVSVTREDTCNRVVRTSWPLFDAVRVGDAVLKDQAGTPMPTPDALQAVCTSTPHLIRLRSE